VEIIAIGPCSRVQFKHDGVEAHRKDPGQDDPDSANGTEFLIAKLKPLRP
jgi:hypothetical protein